MQGNPIKSATPTGPVDASSDVAGRRGEDLSAWLDGELDAQAAGPLVTELLQPGACRRHFDEWCLVGDALRSHEVAAGHSPRLCARIADSLKDEPALLAPRAVAPMGKRPSTLARHIASGVAIAAAAAVVVLVAVPQLREGVVSGSTQLANQQAPTPPAADSGSVALASVPSANSVNGANRNPRLDPYIQAHRDFSGAGVMPAAAVYLRFGNEGDR